MIAAYVALVALAAVLSTVMLVPALVVAALAGLILLKDEILWCLEAWRPTTDLKPVADPQH